MSSTTGGEISITIDGRLVRVPRGITVAAALLDNDVPAFRTSASGQPRGPLCGMGICHECRVEINGAPHRRACLALVADGQAIATGRAR